MNQKKETRAYEKTVWEDGETLISAALMNKIEDKLVDLETTDYLKIVKTTLGRDNLEDVRAGTICYVEEDGVYYTYKNKEWDVFQSGSGGGGTSIGTLTSSLHEKTVSISVGQPLIIDLFFSTPNVGSGDLHIFSKGDELLNRTITMGKNNVELNLEKGEYKLEIYVTDRAGVQTNLIVINVQCGGLGIDTTFDWGKDYSVGAVITFTYTIDTISKDPITTHFKIGNEVYETESENEWNEYIFPELSAGIYTVEVWATSGKFESNKIVNTLSIANSDELFVASLFDKKEAEEGDQLSIGYRVSMKGVRNFNVIYYIDGQEHKKGKALNGNNTFVISSLEKGDRTITIKVMTTDEKHEAQTDIKIKIIESSYQMKKPVEAGLIAWFDAYGLTNLDSEKDIWKDKSGKGYVGKLHNFNYATNGWFDNGLKMNGNAYVALNVKPFLDNVEGGLTIDVVFETEDVGDENARVLDCTTTTSSGVGCYIDVNEALMISDKHTLKSPFAQNEKTRVTYVIDRVGKDKLAKIYINAVLCEVVFLGDKGSGNNTILESFEHDQFIYLNSRKGQDSFGDCTIYSVRVYGRALKSKEVLDNHIADIKDKTLQKKKYDFNYNDTMPTMYFIGDDSEMTKDRAVELQIKYVSTDEQKYGASFDLPKCTVKWQGTSSIVYDVKNYKIKLIDAEGKKVKRSLRGDMIPESTFVLKADYMESSHANNTGCAKIVNRYLYDELLPPQEDNDQVVRAIDGFPIKLYINGKSMGVFNFNLDKGNEDSFGFNKDNPECISYEISANTDSTAGAFNKWNGVPTPDVPDELAYLKKDFELRFPDEDDNPDYGYMKQLKRLVDWVSDASDEKFREEFDQYLNKEYTFKYYLFILAVGMVDNCGKNMMISTWDGKIWYPCFYDLDTCLGLDNSGYIKFDVDIEMEPKVYNTSGSQLWTKVRRVFEKELAKMYRDMRATIFKEEKLFEILLGEQIDQIPESLYNEDSQRKYIDHPKYIHMLHGSRREHMRKWITERLLYLDSKFGYEMNTKQSITVRANKKGWVNFKIKTYSPMYIKVKWRNDESSIMTKKIERNKIVQFDYNLPTETDQEILIYGAKHLKEIGDISHMQPSSLSLGDAVRLTKLECKNSPNLQALGLGGSASVRAVNSLKNLQLIDLTGCSKLGTVASSGGIDVSNCDNLKTLKLHGTNLQSITFNIDGGNLEELYLPNSLTSLYLANQYGLRKVEFPDYSYANTLAPRAAYDSGSKITDLKIINCPNLTQLGMWTTINTNEVRNYRATPIKNQDKDFDISEQEYIKTFKLGCFGRLENVTITNSLLDYKYYNINASPNIEKLSFSDMPNLKGIIFTGNKAYSRWNTNNMEGDPMFKAMQIDKCKNFDTIIMQHGGDNYGDTNAAFKFKKDFEWDLSNLPLKRFICNISLQNLKKLILPSTIEEFSHSNTVLRTNTDVNADGSKSQYTKEMSPLEAIVIKGRYEEGFKGVDLADIPLNNVNLNGLAEKVEIIKNVDCKAIDINPRITQGKVLENIKINLNNYKFNSLNSTFYGADMSKFTVTLEEQLTTENMDYSYMFQNAKNVEWEKIKDFIKKLPPGKFYYTFENCNIDKLEVGHMIGATTTDLNACFRNMPNVIEINLKEADMSNVTRMRETFYNNQNLTTINLEDCVFTNVQDFYSCFSNNVKLEQIIGAENLIQDKCTVLVWMFNNTPKLKFKFHEGKPNWRFYNGFMQSARFMLNCGRDIVLADNEEYVLDLSECGEYSDSNFLQPFEQTGFTKIVMNKVNVPYGDHRSVFFKCPNLKELDVSRIVQFEDPQMGSFARECQKLTTVNMKNMDMSKSIGADMFYNDKNLTDLQFGKGYKNSLNLTTNTNLTKPSLMSIIENIGTANDGAVIRLSQASLDLLSDSDKQIAIDKKWTITKG